MLSFFPDGPLTNALWVDLFQPTAEEVAQVREATGLRIPTESQISEIESTSRLGFENGTYYLSTPLIAPREWGEHALVPVGFVLSKRLLLTVRFAELPSIESARTACDNQPTHSSDDAFLRILEVVVDRSADKLEHASAECDEFSRKAFRSPGRVGIAGNLQSTLQQIGAVADRTSLVRDGLLGLGRIGAYIMESGFADAPPVNPARMKAIRADVASLTEYEGHLSTKVSFLLDATLGFINIQQNDIVKTLTIASVVGIPPVLIAGIYGMNFKYMPELEWHPGYPLALGAIVVSALIPLLWFKRRGWM